MSNKENTTNHPPKMVSVHLHAEENPHVYSDPLNAYEKGSFYCVLTSSGKTIMYPIATIWRITTVL